MNRKVQTRIITVCPYVTAEEAQKFWNQARVIARKSGRGLQGVQYWNVVAKITEAMAKKLDEKRRQADEAEWEASQRKDMWEDGPLLGRSGINGSRM